MHVACSREIGPRRRGAFDRSATPSGTNGLNVTARCVGLTASNDLRTVDGDITLTLSNCTVR